MSSFSVFFLIVDMMTSDRWSILKAELVAETHLFTGGRLLIFFDDPVWLMHLFAWRSRPADVTTPSWSTYPSEFTPHTLKTQTVEEQGTLDFGRAA